MEELAINAHHHRNFIIKSIFAVLIGTALACLIWLTGIGKHAFDNFIALSRIFFPLTIAGCAVLGTPCVLFLKSRNINSLKAYIATGILCGVGIIILYTLAMPLLYPPPEVSAQHPDAGSGVLFLWIILVWLPGIIPIGAFVAAIYWSICISDKKEKSLLYSSIAIVAALVISYLQKQLT